MSLVDELIALLGAKNLITDAAEMASSLEDWRGRYSGEALCIARPASTEEVSAVVACCHRHKVPVLPQGGNTGLVGGSVPSSSGPAPVIVNLQRMRRISVVDPINNSMEVQAGCVLAAVQDAAQTVDRLYPVSLGAEGSCQIGGTIATNAGGISVLRYGNTRDNVLGLEVVLADGTIWSELRALRKDNTGYDLKHLFIGSEGTLGIITAAVLKLHPLPTRAAVAWVGVSSPSKAIELLVLTRQLSGSSLSAFELMNQLQLDLVVEHVPQRRSPLETEHPWYVLIELADTGGSADPDTALTGILEQAFENAIVDNAAIASNETQRAAMWEVRHSVSEANKKGGVGLTTDCAVPVSTIDTFIERANAAVSKITPQASIVIVGHMGDGNIHYIPFFPFAVWNALEQRETLGHALRRAVNDVAAALSGTFSAEHGVGQTSLDEMNNYKSSASLALMRAIKQAVDPLGLFNPGRLIPPEK
ncbi:FAD-binding oxidoreductase [Pseudomonas fluorescens]|uniref:Putative FAD-linked oxidoreductase n=1 Tax=Pseudomonas fluorescens TaxID=294 RepID=A0A5E7FQL0_PSEFL|nr:FAD-binding oxidoreductase [Pseudomonas fluorescens]VVO40577.1 putative FAD-linked oxidoreductase [Pseudomonas fluorescens]